MPSKYSVYLKIFIRYTFLKSMKLIFKSWFRVYNTKLDIKQLRTNGAPRIYVFLIFTFTNKQHESILFSLQYTYNKTNKGEIVWIMMKCAWETFQFIEIAWSTVCDIKYYLVFTLLFLYYYFVFIKMYFYVLFTNY